MSLLSSTIIPKNTVEESLTRKTITSNHDSDDNRTDNRAICSQQS